MSDLLDPEYLSQHVNRKLYEYCSDDLDEMFQLIDPDGSLRDVSYEEFNGDYCHSERVFWQSLFALTKIKMDFTF